MQICMYSPIVMHAYMQELIYICPVVAVNLVISVASISHCCTLQLLDHVGNMYSDSW